MKEILLNFVETWEISTWLLVMIFWCLIIVIALFIFIWYKLRNNIFEWKKNLEYQYDKLFYLLAKFQEKNPQYKTNTYVMDALFELQNPDYIHNYNLIVSKIDWLKASLNETVVPQTELLQLKKILKQLRLKRWLESFLSIIIVILVVALIFVCVRKFVMF